MLLLIFIFFLLMVLIIYKFINDIKKLEKKHISNHLKDKYQDI